jgi:hypothetical protein
MPVFHDSSLIKRPGKWTASRRLACATGFSLEPRSAVRLPRITTTKIKRWKAESIAKADLTFGYCGDFRELCFLTGWRPIIRTKDLVFSKLSKCSMTCRDCGFLAVSQMVFDLSFSICAFLYDTPKLLASSGDSTTRNQRVGTLIHFGPFRFKIDRCASID